MANRRMISKSISSSKKVTKLYNLSETDNSFSVLLFTWLQPHTDDFGRFDADPFTIKHEIIPTFYDKSESDIQIALNKMYSVKLVYLYEKDNRKIGQVINFEEHQSGLGKRTKSKYPDPDNEEFQEFLRNSEK